MTAGEQQGTITHRDCRSGEVAIEPANSVPSAYLFFDDDGRVLRFQLDAERVRIGRDVSNDIWIDHPHVRPHTLLVFRRDADHHLKVYDGAKVLLNGAPVVGIHRLYGGDRIGLADREFLYGRDDTPAEMAIGLTVMRGGAVLHACVLRRTVVRIGRHGSDLQLDDPSVADNHLILECYGTDSVFVVDPVASNKSQPPGAAERRRVGEGALLQVGIFSLRLHLLPADAHGLLLPTARPDKPKIPLGALPPMDRSPGQRRDPGAQSPRQRAADLSPVQGGFIRPADAANAGSERTDLPPPLQAALVPVTEIASLAMIRAAHEARPPQPPAVRIKPEVLAAAGEDVLPPWQGAPPPLPSAPPLHDQNTQVLDQDAIAVRLREQPPPLRPPSGVFVSGPLTQVLDTTAGRGELLRAPQNSAPIPRPSLRPEARPPPLPGEADPSQRHVRHVVVDRSRRMFDETQTQHDKPKP